MGRPRWRRIGGQARSQEFFIAGDEAVPVLRRETPGAGDARLVGRRFHLPEQILEVFGPDLVILLLQKGQLPQMMDITERMPATGVGSIRLPAVMDTDALVAGQDADGAGRFGSALGMDPVVGQLL